ncbi:CYFA0S24e00540g1_1 [Cyberlindnera fabianii]|uniref:alpha-1,2-Mannosidase n=1 Tax=Cyberlindnera fabianii TaxID=36022 RepID=A0A061B9I5_CYBFA|nr:CYFA0S24e00540g1_1 [Cyberlindnera fabianii]
MSSLAVRLLIIYLFTWSLASPVSSASTIHEGSYTHEHLSQLKNRTRALFDHGWNSYMKYGYPADEVRPLSCERYESSDDIHDIHRNDVLGNYSVTFLDTITTFAVFEDIPNFEKYVWMLKGLKSFDIDSTVQVFETSIRALGSLLSAHLYASDRFKLPNYDGFLLDLAYDLGSRLLTAYNTSSGIPLARVNLHDPSRKLPKDLIEETCTAGAASPMLEMTLLSILTNETSFEMYSRTAFMTLWNSRSKLDLVPMSINPQEGKWLNAITGIGASIDSFYEYALKGAVLFDDDELQSVWQQSIRALLTHGRNAWFVGNVQVETGNPMSSWIDALGAFFPGLLVLSGKVDDAKRMHQPYTKLWNKYNGIPERWDFILAANTPMEDPISLEWYPLRPEFIESTYYLYRATRDPIYLRIGEAVLHDYEELFKAPCGFAGFKDVRTRESQDRMESFVLSETFMYLYLLFDEENALNKEQNFVFSTEGHPMWIPKGVLKQYKELKRSKLASRVKLEDVVAETSTMGLLIEKIKAWPTNEIANAANYLKGFFSAESNSEEEANTKAAAVIEQAWFEKLGFDLTELDQDSCPVTVGTNGLYSEYLSNDETFDIDWAFAKHFAVTMMDLEISSDFYWTYAKPDSQCRRSSETNIVDYHVGRMSHPLGGSVLKFVSPIEGDDVSKRRHLWVHDLNGLHIVFEILKDGKVDSYNNLLSYQNDIYPFYENLIYDLEGSCPMDSDKRQDRAYRVHTINGIDVKEGMMVYVSPANAERGLLQSGVVGLTGNGYLMIDDTVVTNMALMTVVTKD